MQRLERERHRDVELEHLLAGVEDPADPAEVELGLVVAAICSMSPRSSSLTRLAGAPGSAMASR